MITCTVVSMTADGVLGEQVELRQFDLNGALEFLRDYVYDTEVKNPNTEVWMDGEYRFIKVADDNEGTHVFTYKQNA
jgi:hypothetical protein